ncbi:hypothetical protein [Bacillus sp. Marseille-P3800]|uniref:hypothetical protein n=1 Tax=Bacillus sp. Marseille-P3800 TaxID=2014782 RepID=UPI000C07EA29|nr:hypothetical protein [Bacillus sp. Marseille-P3800]
MRLIYVIRIDEAYQSNMYTIVHTNRRKALADFYSRVKEYGIAMEETAVIETDTENEIAIDVRDRNSLEGRTYYFNAVTAGTELDL